MSPDLKQLFKFLFVLLREKNKSRENFKAGLQRVVILLDHNRKLKNELEKLFARVYAKQQDLHLKSYRVIFDTGESLVPVETRESAKKERPASEHTVENRGNKDKWHFHMRQGTARSCMLVMFMCRLLHSLYSLWGQGEFLLVSNNNSTTGLVTYKIEPNSMLSLESDKELKESLHRSLDNATFANILKTRVYSDQFVLGPLDELIVKNSPAHISTLMIVRLLLDYHVLYTNSKVGGVRGTKPHARTLQDIWKTYTIVNGTEVSTLKWDLADKPAALEVVRANYHTRVKTVLRSALKTIGMYFENGKIPPVITEYAQQASIHQDYVKASSRKLLFEWVLIRDQNNTNDIHALDLFIGNICDTLKERTNATEFETRKLNMALLFKKVYTELKNKSAGLCATINAPKLWQSNHTKAAPISMHDLFTDAFTIRLANAKKGEKHDVFIYEMVTYDYHFVHISEELKKTTYDIEMHVLFEVFLQTLSFQCTEHTNFALKPVFIGYVRGNNRTPQQFPHYIDFAQSDHLLHQLVPLLLPRKWKAVSGDTVRGMTLAPDSQVLNFTDFKPWLTYNLQDVQEMFASDTYELTRDAYTEHIFYDNMYIHVSTGAKELFLVPYTGTHIDPRSFLSFVAAELQRGLSANVFNNLVHAKAKIWSKIPLQLELLVSIVQDQIFPQLSWDLAKIVSTAVVLYFNPLRLLVTFMMWWLEKIHDKATKNLGIFHYIIACLLTMMFILFNFLDVTSSQAKGIPKLEALIGSFDMVGFLDIIFDLFFVACNMYQFSIECGDSFNIPDTLGYYNRNFLDSSNQQEMKNCFVNKNTLDHLLNTMRECSDDLEAHFDKRAGRAKSVRDYAEIVVGYCRVLSLRMLVLYYRQVYHKQTNFMQQGTFRAFVECHKTLVQFYNKHYHSINDETIIEVNNSTNTTVKKFKQFFENASNDGRACTSMQTQLQTLLSSVNSPMKNGDRTTHSMLKNLTFLMLGFFIKQRACLVMLAQFAEGESQRRAQHKLYHHFKYQASLQHDALFARCLAFCTAVFEMQYYGSLLYCYYARPPGSFATRVRLVPHSSDDIVRTFEDASGTLHRIHLHETAFSRTVRREIELAESEYVPMIASAVENLTTDDSDSARSGSSPRSDATDREDLHAGSDSAEEDTGAATGAARPDARGSDSGSSDASTAEDSNSGSDALSRKPTKDIIMELLCMRPEASVEQVNGKLEEILTSLEEDRTEKKNHLLLKLVKIFELTSKFHNCNGASLDLCIQILTERVLNTFAKLDIGHVRTCLTHIQTLKAGCAKTDIFEQKIKALERALAQRLKQESTCLFLEDSSQCVETLKQLMQGV